MTRLKSDSLILQTNTGEQIPCSAEWVTLELVGDIADIADPEAIRHAAAAVLHYFKHELHREFVSVAEFASALERTLRAIGINIFAEADTPPLRVSESDLPALMKGAGENCELFFFPQLRQELLRHLDDAPNVMRFSGLRPCVKQLAGAGRWSRRCETLSDQIVDYLRTCLHSDARSKTCTLVVK